MTDLSVIIALRMRKSDKALGVLRTHEGSVQQHHMQVQHAQQDVDDFKKKISTMERDLLLELIEKSVSIGAIVDVERQMKAAEAEAKRLVEAVQTAKSALEEAERACNEQKHVVRLAQGKLNRFQELDKHVTLENKIKAVATEDAVIDEFVETSFGRRH